MYDTIQQSHSRAFIGKNQYSKRQMHRSVHGSTVYNSPNMEAT